MRLKMRFHLLILCRGRSIFLARRLRPPSVFSLLGPTAAHSGPCVVHTHKKNFGGNFLDLKKNRGIFFGFFSRDSTEATVHWSCRHGPGRFRMKWSLLVQILPPTLILVDGLFICSVRQVPSARRQCVFGYPKQSSTVSLGSVL
jgi:hypothetical protein